MVVRNWKGDRLFGGDAAGRGEDAVSDEESEVGDLGFPGGTGRSVPCIGGDEAGELVVDCKIWWRVSGGAEQWPVVTRLNVVRKGGR